MADWPWNLTFEVAFDTNPDTEPGALDWTDLSDRLREPAGGGPGVVLRRGVQAGARAPQSAGEIWLNNDDRALDPTNPAALYNVAPMRHARFKATVNGVTHDVWRGYASKFPPIWPEYSQALIRVGLVGGLARLGLQDANVDLPEEESHDRVNTLLAAAGWPLARRDLGTGRVRLEPHEQEGANLLRLLLDAVAAEDGDLWESPTGDIVFRGRHHRLDQTSQMTVSAAAVPYESVDTARSQAMAEIVNIGRVELADGETHTYQDQPSIDAHGPADISIRDLPLRAAEAHALAMWAVVRFKDPNVWLSGLTFHGLADDAAGAPVHASLLQRDLTDLITFQRTPPGGGTQVDEDQTLEQIRHEITKGGWRTVFDLVPYFGAGPWLTFDDASSTWDVGKWAP